MLYPVILAKEKLSAEARANIENGITNYQSETGENYSNVVSGAQTAISNQKALRTELLTPTDVNVGVTDGGSTDGNATSEAAQ